MAGYIEGLTKAFYQLLKLLFNNLLIKVSLNKNTNVFKDGFNKIDHLDKYINKKILTTVLYFSKQ